MMPSPFRTFPFIENAFARRFQAMLSSARYNRSWHVLVADPGAGKTTCIRDLQKRAGGRSILAVVTPKNNDDEQALGDQIFAALGVTIRGHWSTRKPKLMGHLHQFGTECLVVDDAHDLSMPHLMFLKEVTDQGRLQYDHPLGLCLVAAGRGNTIPLKEILDQSEPTWLQWRRRLDPMQPFCRIAGHTSEEIREILATLETVFQPLLPQLNLRQWTGSMYDWLTHTVLDPTSSGRVSMDNLMKLVIAALEWSYEAKATDVQVEYLERAAELLVLRHDTFRIIDGDGPDAPVSQSDEAEPEKANGAEPQWEMVQENEQQNTTETVEEQVQTGKMPKCTFPGLVSIDLKRFEDSDTHLVECPGCGRTRTLSLSKGVIKFPSHEKRKMNTPNTGKRWAMLETIWEIVGG
jgi:hypothetical protein